MLMLTVLTLPGVCHCPCAMVKFKCCAGHGLQVKVRLGVGLEQIRANNSMINGD